MPTRRNLDETRQRILDAGAEMMAEAGFSLQSANISLIDACRRAGLSTAGSGYKIWSSQDEFREELTRHALVIHDDRSEPSERLVEAVADLGDSPSLVDVIRVAATDNAQAVIGTEWFARLVALWLAASSDPELRAAQIQTQHQLRTKLAETFQALLDVYDREFVAPFTLEMLTLAICAEMNGLGYFCAYDDDPAITTVERPTGAHGAAQQWHLMGCVVEALVNSFTRPRATVVPDPR